MFEPGTVIEMREVHDGDVWAVRPMRVVRDDEHLLAVWLPRGTPWWRPIGLDGSVWRIPVRPWRLVEDVWQRLDVLQLVERTGDGYAPYAIWHTWREGRFIGWYVNLQSPLVRIESGFEYLDHALDLIVTPALEHRWKDEDELEAYVEHGIFSREDAEEVRRHAEGVLRRAQRGDSPFDGSWRGFRPDPAWSLPPRPRLPRDAPDQANRPPGVT